MIKLIMNYNYVSSIYLNFVFTEHNPCYRIESAPRPVRLIDRGPGAPP